MDRRKLPMSIQTFMTVLAVLFATLVVSDHRLGLSDQLGVGLAYSTYLPAESAWQSPNQCVKH